MATEGEPFEKAVVLARWLLLLCATLALAALLVVAEFNFFKPFDKWIAWNPMRSLPSRLVYLSVAHALIANVVVRAGLLVGPGSPRLVAWATFAWGATLAGWFALWFVPDPSFDEMAAVVGIARAREYALGEYATGMLPLLSALGAGALTARRMAADNIAH